MNEISRSNIYVRECSRNKSRQKPVAGTRTRTDSLLRGRSSEGRNIALCSAFAVEMCVAAVDENDLPGRMAGARRCQKHGHVGQLFDRGESSLKRD